MVVLVGWELVGTAGSPYFPRPSSWGPALAGLGEDAVLAPAVAATLSTFVIALAVATAAGTALGFLVGFSDGADRALGPSFEFARAMPPAAIVPVATLLIGYDGNMKVAVVTLAAVWPILLNTRAGVQGLDPLLLDTAASLQLSRFDRARKVVLPALLPSVFLGVKVAAPIALVITLLVEFLTNVAGLGALIATAQRSFRSAEVYGLIVVAGLLSLAVNGVVATLESRVLRSRRARTTRAAKGGAG